MKDKKIIENCQLAEKKLRAYGKADSNEVLKKFKSSTKGLSVVEIEERLDEYGKNTIEIENNSTLIKKIKDAVINPFNIVLILVAAVTLVTDVILPAKKDYATFVLILGTIIISAIISLRAIYLSIPRYFSGTSATSFNFASLVKIHSGSRL